MQLDVTRMGLVFAAALAAPLLLWFRRRQFAADLPRALVVAVPATLLATAGAMTLWLGHIDDVVLFILAYLVGSPVIGVTVAAVVASRLVKAPGYGIAAVIMAVAGWVIGLVVLLVIDAVTDLRAASLFSDLAILLAIPSSFAATCAVYARVLGKRH